jgi:hypothetical protein
MRKVWIELTNGADYEHSGDLDIIANENGVLQVMDYSLRNKRNIMGNVFIVGPGHWRTAEMSDEYEQAPAPSLEELNTRLAAYDAARAAFGVSA